MYFENFDLVGKTLFQAGLNSSHSGNISVFDRSTNIVYIKRTGTMLHALKISDIVTVDIDTLENAEHASSELPAHIALYKNTKANAIVHCHPPTAIGLSLQRKFIDNDYSTDYRYSEIPMEDIESNYHLKNSVFITKEVAYGKPLSIILPKYFNQNNTIIARGHGSFSIGKTLEECLHYATTLEQACKIFVTMKNSN